ncbi:AAA family ATPase [Rhizobium laguerreae]|uniref:AAA family ATPase n=1 Tax=Rhizobium laguerreae TaxID=1076926 RepID=UPI001A8D3885|nr:ATP-binding protein [Rhizobium laguerreae]MBN9987144.1 ATP-binding protein [Rhizobium laguerreae]
MVISVSVPNRSGMSAFPTTFALQQDNWNDYNFQTLYHLYYNSGGAAAPPTLIGGVKILRRGQTKLDGLQVSQAFERLDDRYCSVGTSLDYYQRLNEIPADQREEILSALRDVVAHPTLTAEFSAEPGWRTSLFRDNPDPSAFLDDAAAIYKNKLGDVADIGQVLTFRPANWNVPVILNFDAPFSPFAMFAAPAPGIGQVNVGLPRRVIAIVGRNGSGKSTLLSRIARVAYSAPSDRLRHEIASIGVFDPLTIGFLKIIAISYSAFDNFIVPGIYETELQQIANDIEKGSGRYIYAGLRDIVAEVRDDIANAASKVFAPGERARLESGDRRTTTKLKSLEQLAEEFERLITQIVANNDEVLFDEALLLLLADPSFADIETQARLELIGSDPRSAFLSWSTGHKIALHVVASLVAHCTRKSIVLFDEPETHLHPPLIAALMHSVRLVLERKNAFAIVATHSPVILQETLARHVRIIRRNGDIFDVLSPGIETFGENVGALTYDTFGLTAASSDFYRVLDWLIAAHSTLDQINHLFSPSLSGQALSYVLAGLARKAQQP